MRCFRLVLFVSAALLCAGSECEDGRKDPDAGVQCGYAESCDPVSSEADALCLDLCSGECGGLDKAQAGWCFEVDRRCLCVCLDEPNVCALSYCFPGKVCQAGGDDCTTWCAEEVCDGPSGIRGARCAENGACECICRFTGVSTCNFELPDVGE